jgi:DNA-binding MarR family transcriptional regulator
VSECSLIVKLTPEVLAWCNSCIMQVFPERSKQRSARGGTGIAAQLDAQFSEMARILASRRLRSSLYAGAGELPQAQLHALIALSQDELRMTELASRLGLAESTVTRMIDRLDAAGLVKRHLAKPDRRSVLVELTRAGRRMAAEIEASRREFMAEVLGTLEPQERKELVRLFAKVTEALQRREANSEVR